MPIDRLVYVILMLTFLTLLRMVVSVVLKESRYELNYSAEDFTKLMQTCNGSPREFTKVGYEWNFEIGTASLAGRIVNPLRVW